MTLTLAGGFERAWAAGSMPEQQPILQGDSVILGPLDPPFDSLPQEFFAIPRAESASIEGLTLEVYAAGKTWSETHDSEKNLNFLVAAGAGAARFAVRWDRIPEPPREAVPATHPDREEELRALGYIDD